MSRNELRRSFTPSYLGGEDILASQTRIPCQTTVKISTFGFLDPSQESEDLEVGSSVELPLWAARKMIKNRQQPSFVKIKAPIYFNENFREILKADPAVVNLHKMGPHYYQTGLQLCSLALPEEDGEQMADGFLNEVFQRRIMAMLDAYSLNRDVKSTGDRIEILGGGGSGIILPGHFMDTLETQLFQDAKKASDELDDWLRRIG